MIMNLKMVHEFENGSRDNVRDFENVHGKMFMNFKKCSWIQNVPNFEKYMDLKKNMFTNSKKGIKKEKDKRKEKHENQAKTVKGTVNVEPTNKKKGPEKTRPGTL